MSPLEKLLDVISRLRGENGCPWDKEQTLKSLKPCLIEESYELIDAIDSDDIENHKEELGDVLLQLVMQAQIRSESGAFSFNDVINELCEKLIRRHPHVFGDIEVENSAQVLKNWEAIKRKEKATKRDSVVDGLPRHVPALQKAARIQSRVSRVGFDWSEIEQVMAKVDEELEECRAAIKEGDMAHVEEELGDLLFSVVNTARFLGIDAESALRSTIDKFEFRFREVERRIHAEGKELSECSLDDMDKHWVEIKRKNRDLS